MEKQRSGNNDLPYFINEQTQRKLATDVGNVTQLLHAVKMNMQWFRQKFSKLTQQVNAPFDQMMATVDLAVQYTDQIERELWPTILDYIGLIPALEHLLSLFQKSSQHAFVFYTDENIKLNNLDDYQNLTIFTTFQALLSYLAHERDFKQTIFEVTISCTPSNITIEISDKRRNDTFTDSVLTQVKNNIREPKNCSIELQQKHIVLMFDL